MKNKFFLSLLLLISCKLYTRFSGGQPAQFLNFIANARSSAMGKAFYSISDDASAPYFNPAGLGLLERIEISALHAGIPELFYNTQTQYDFISFIYPTIKLGNFGVSLVRLNSSGFKRIKIIQQAGGTLTIKEEGTFEVNEMAFILAYGKRVLENMLIGGALKYIGRNVDYHSDSFITSQVSLLYQGLNKFLPRLSLAVGIKNLLSSNFDTTEDELPRILRFGISNKFLRDRLTVAIDIEKNVNAGVNWYLGTEYWLLDFLSLRFGFDGEIGVRETSLGVGVKYKDYILDYALALHSELGLSHRISASWKFGRPISEKKVKLLENLIKEVEEHIRQGNFLYALKKTEKIIEIDPTNKPAQNILKQLQKVVPFIPSATEDTDVASGIRRAVDLLIRGDTTGAVSALKYSYYKDPQNTKLLAFLNLIEKEIGMIPTELYREEIPGWTIIDKKIYDARQAILQGRPEQALIYCQEILNLEPRNITALEIMGSAFFMMNQPEQAKHIWKKVLELDPTNRIVPIFLEELEKK